MSITNYSELQAAVAAWVKRSDLTARIPDFIRLAEIRLKSVVYLRTLETTADLLTTPSSATIAKRLQKPSGFVDCGHKPAGEADPVACAIHAIQRDAQPSAILVH